VTLTDEGRPFTVSFGDEGLVVDPTDKQVADADHLGQWYRLEYDAIRNLRAMLRGGLTG
jgi:hypothetical protein